MYLYNEKIHSKIICITYFILLGPVDIVPHQGSPIPHQGDPIPHQGDPVPHQGSPIPHQGGHVPQQGDHVPGPASLRNSYPLLGKNVH